MAERQLLPPDEMASVDPAVFKDGYVLTAGETAVLLNQYLTTRSVEIGSTYQMPPMVKKTKDYVERFASCRNEESLKALRAGLLTDTSDLKEYEFAILVNMMPETPEEAMALLPSLKDPARFSEDKLEEILHELASYRQFQ